MTLSVAIITFNEERIIGKTLSAISDLADEIIVVDSFSTDSTPDIIKKLNVRFYQEKWQGYAKQKNLAISKCTGNWILVLDADEVITEDLKLEIKNLLQRSTCDGYKIARKLYIGNKWIRFGGYFPDYQLRLFKNNIGACFRQREVHESICLDSEVGYLKNPLEHYAYEDISDYKQTLDRYARLASVEIKNKLFYLPSLRALWTFLFRYLFRLGFLEGSIGLAMGKIYAEYVYKKYDLAKASGKN